MKRVYSSQIRPSVEYVKDILEEHGIPCMITGGEYLGVAIGEIPPIETWPGVWVLNDSDEASALQTISTLEQNESQNFAKWQCPQCNEQCENQFDTCWNCGSPKKS